MPKSKWVVLGTYRSGTGFKIIARDGARVVHAEKLSAADVESFDPEAAWAKRSAAPAKMGKALEEMLRG